MRTHDTDGPDNTDPNLNARQEQARSGFRAAVAAIMKDVLETGADDQRDEPKRASMGALLRRADDLVAQVFDANEESSRQRLKTQANWFQLKLETSRIASETRLEHKAVEINAACAAKFDQKLRELAEEGGSVEGG